MSNTYFCCYPGCTRNGTTSPCETCKERIQRNKKQVYYGDNHFCRDHSKCNFQDHHRVLNIVRLSANDKKSYRALLETPFTSLPTPRGNNTTTLNVTFFHETRNISSEFEVASYEYGDAILLPPGVKIPGFYVRHQQCFWVALAYHVRTWPFLLRIDALCRLNGIMPQLDFIFGENPAVSANSSIHDAINIMQHINAKTEAFLARIKILSGITWAFNRNDTSKFIDVYYLLIDSIPELVNFNFVVMTVRCGPKDFVDGGKATSNIDNECLLAYPSDNRKETVAIMLCHWPQLL